MQAALEKLIILKARSRQREIAFMMPELWPIKTGGGAGAPSKADKINRTIGFMVRDGRAWFRPEMTTLFAQMDFYNPNSQKNDDDILDAAGMMVQTVPYFAPSHWGNVEYEFGRDFVWKTFNVEEMDHLCFPQKSGTLKERVFAH